MPVYYNKNTGAPENTEQYNPEIHDIPLVNAAGEHFSAPESELGEYLKQGYAQPSVEQLGQILDKAKYESTGEQLKTFAEGAASGVLGPLAPVAEKAYLGATDETINKRREINPGVHTLGTATTLVGSSLAGVGLGAALGKAGEAVGAATAGLGKIGSGAARGAIENALFQSGDEISKMITNDPTTSAEVALSNVGMSALLGGGVGAAFGTVAKSWEMLNGSKLAGVLDDFKARAKLHLDNPELEMGLTDELQSLHTDINRHQFKKMSREELAPLLQKANPETVFAKSEELVTTLENKIADMRLEPHRYPERLVRGLETDLEAFKSKAMNNTSDASDVFDALKDLKGKAQQNAKFGIDRSPTGEAYQFTMDSKSIAYELRQALEDTKVWGKAGEVEARLNANMANYLSKLKGVESRIMTKVGRDRVVDPGKLQTLLRQQGSIKGKVKDTAVQEFVEAAKAYINDASKIAQESGIQRGAIGKGLALTDAVVGKQLGVGAKMADALIKHGLGDLAGAGVGGVVGSSVGHPIIGALLGKKLLGSTFNSSMKSIVRPLIESSTSSSGFKAAVEYGHAVAKGESMLRRSTEAVFDAGTKAVGMPSAKEIERLSKQVDKVAVNPESLMETANHVGHYLPDHGTTLSTTALRNAQYLASLKPNTNPVNPLDEERVPNDVEQGKYNEALAIAQKPTIVLDSVKDGSITLDQIKHLKTMYPALYGSMQTKLMEQLINNKSKGKTIPYKTKLGLSAFMGQPLDSSMTPHGIQSNQMMPQMQAPQMSTKQPKVGLNAPIGKMPGLFGTRQQNRGANRH